MRVDWSEPVFSGKAVSAYKIYVRKADGQYSLEFNECDGSLEGIKNSRSCSIKVPTLKATPYSLPWGGSVFA